jgi:hypothetical protein
MGGTQPTVRTDFNGAGTDGALAFGTNNDRNTSSLVNYSQMIITFSQSVMINSFVIGDVDHVASGASWEDFIYLEGRFGGAGGTLRTTTYTTSPSYNIVATYLGLTGVRGNAGDAPGSTDLAIVAAAFDAPVTYIRFLFFQGPGATGSSAHRIWIQDIDFIEVPEPPAYVLALTGIALVLLAAIKRPVTIRQEPD